MPLTPCAHGEIEFRVTWEMRPAVSSLDPGTLIPYPKGEPKVHCSWCGAEMKDIKVQVQVKPGGV